MNMHTLQLWWLICIISGVSSESRKHVRRHYKNGVAASSEAADDARDDVDVMSRTFSVEEGSTRTTYKDLDRASSAQHVGGSEFLKLHTELLKLYQKLLGDAMSRDQMKERLEHLEEQVQEALDIKAAFREVQHDVQLLKRLAKEEHNDDDQAPVDLIGAPNATTTSNCACDERTRWRQREDIEQMRREVGRTEKLLNMQHENVREIGQMVEGQRSLIIRRAEILERQVAKLSVLETEVDVQRARAERLAVDHRWLEFALQLQENQTRVARKELLELDHNMSGLYSDHGHFYTTISSLQADSTSCRTSLRRQQGKMNLLETTLKWIVHTTLQANSRDPAPTADAVNHNVTGMLESLFYNLSHSATYKSSSSGGSLPGGGALTDKQVDFELRNLIYQQTVLVRNSSSQQQQLDALSVNVEEMKDELFDCCRQVETIEGKMRTMEAAAPPPRKDSSSLLKRVAQLESDFGRIRKHLHALQALRNVTWRGKGDALEQDRVGVDDGADGEMRRLNNMTHGTRNQRGKPGSELKPAWREENEVVEDLSEVEPKSPGPPGQQQHRGGVLATGLTPVEGSGQEGMTAGAAAETTTTTPGLRPPKPNNNRRHNQTVNQTNRQTTDTRQSHRSKDRDIQNSPRGSRREDKGRHGGKRMDNDAGNKRRHGREKVYLPSSPLPIGEGVTMPSHHPFSHVKQLVRPSESDICAMPGIKIGRPRVVTSFSLKISGAWMRDPEARTDHIYVFYDTKKVNNVREYADESALRSRNVTALHHMPFRCTGTGHVVYNGSVYCNKFQSNRLMKYDLETGDVASRKLRHAAFGNTYPYSGGGYTDIDLAVDEAGLWVIYTSKRHAGNITIGKLDANTLDFHGIWTTNYPKKKAADSFMICGRLYVVAYDENESLKIDYVFDTRYDHEYLDGGRGLHIETFSDSITMLDYNPKDSKLYSWDISRGQLNGNLINHDLYFRG